jgi:hypothetical protein
MWKLTITRKYQTNGSQYTWEAKFEYEFEYMEDAVTLIETTNDHAVNGEYEFCLVYEEGEQK